MLPLSHNFSLKDKLKAIAKATYTHSRNLAYFVFIYKGLQALQVKIQGKSLQSQSFLAACLGGWLVFGDNNNINSQVSMQIQLRLSVYIYINTHTHIHRQKQKLHFLHLFQHKVSVQTTESMFRITCLSNKCSSPLCR